MYHGLIITHLAIAYAHDMYYKYHIRMRMNKFYLNEYK